MKIMVTFLNPKNKRKDLNRKHMENAKKIQINEELLKRKKYDYEKNDLLNKKTKDSRKKFLSNINSIKDIEILKGKHGKIEESHEGKNLKYNFCSNNILNLCIYIVCASLFIYFISLNKDIIVKCINLRQAEKNDINLSNMLSLTAIGNKDNYIFKEVAIKENINKEKVYDSVAQMIDSKTNDIADVNVFFNKDSTTVNVIEENSSFQRVLLNDCQILNYSSNRDIDYASLLNSDIYLTKASDKILLYNTHTSESYSNSDEYKFEYTDTMRTTDASYNMLEIAKTLNEILNDKGINSTQNTTPHDYGTYTSAYMNSRKTVQDALNSMQGAGITIDVHRDAIEDLTFRPVVNIDNVQIAQLMLVVGAGTSNSPNPYFLDNLRLALRIQEVASKIYPGLFRPMIIRNSVYNQDLNKYSLLVEFGATGNTIEEVKLSTRCLANLINVIYKD